MANRFGSVKGIIGTFMVEGSVNDYIVVVDGEPLASPVACRVIIGSTNQLFFPATLSDEDSGRVVSILTDSFIGDAYKSIGMKGFFAPVASTIDYSSLPLGKFVPRVMNTGILDYNEKYYRLLLKDIYPFKEEFKSRERDFTKSLAYPPFAEAVKHYSQLPEADYELNSDEEKLMAGIKSGRDKFVLLQGYPGTGKSTALKIICIKLGLPYRQVTGQYENADQLVGCYTVDYSSGNEQVVFLPGALLECVEHGGLLCIEEINYSRGDVLSVLQGLVDNSIEFHEKNSKRLIPIHDNFVLAGTLNPRAQDSFKLNEALVNRATSVLNYPKETPDGYVKKLTKLYPDVDKDFINKLSTVPDIVDNWSKTFNSTGFCSMRQLVSFIDSCFSSKLTRDNFVSEFILRVINPACQCNSFCPEKISAFIAGNDFNILIDSLYGAYDIEASGKRPDLDWILGGSSSGISNTIEDDETYGDTKTILNGFKQTVNK